MTSLSSRPDNAVTDVEQIEVRPRNIGSRIKRVEDRRLLTGQGMFTDDRAVPGALHVAFLRSIHAHALISCIDIGTATDVPGFVGIYKAEHLEALVPPVRATSRMRNYHATPIYPLARGKVRYVGEPVVAVVAESRSLAEDALDRIEIAVRAFDACC
jgi:carbon-monoxide dehydrogenase large subunit